MDKLKAKAAALARRHRRVRGRISGTVERPRLVVSRSKKNIYAQLVDDVARTTLASASTLESEVRKAVKRGSNVDAAKAVGTSIGKRAIEIGVSSAVFDRGGHLYHGRVKALADGARDAGLKL